MSTFWFCIPTILRYGQGSIGSDLELRIFAALRKILASCWLMMILWCASCWHSLIKAWSHDVSWLRIAQDPPMKDETTRIPTAHWVMVRASGSDLPGPLSMQEKVFFFRCRPPMAASFRSNRLSRNSHLDGWHISSADANSMKLPVACGKNPGCQIGSHQFPVQLVFCPFVVYFVVYNCITLLHL